MCPVSMCLGWSNVLPRQCIEASDVGCHGLSTHVEDTFVFSSVVVDREQYRHNDDHQRHEYDDHRPDQSNKEVPIQPTLRLELFVLDVEDPADPFDWVRGHRFYSQSVLYEICLGLTVCCKRISQGVSGQWEWYSLYPPPYSRALEQEESRDFECEKPQTDCNVEYKSLERDPLLVLAHPRFAVEDVQNASIAARIAAIGHVDYRCRLEGIFRRMNEKEVAAVMAGLSTCKPSTMFESLSVKLDC